MNNDPVVYVPTQPEGNGLTLPALLSLLAHGIVLGVLIYTYQPPKLEIAGSIETTMVTPGELAEIQGQILANRAASSEQAASASSNGSSEMQTSESINSSDQNNTQPVPVFIPSNESSQPMLMSEEQHQKYIEQMQEYNRSVAESAAALDGTQALDDFQQQQRDELIEEQRRLGDFRAKSNDRPKITKPTRSDRNINIELGGSNNAGKNFDLADGQATVSGGSPINSNGGSSRSTGDFKSGIADKIQRNLNAPTQTQGITARITLRLDARGNVLSAKASGSNAEVNKAAEKAAYDASPLPIDLDNAKAFASLVINVTVT